MKFKKHTFYYTLIAFFGFFFLFQYASADIIDGTRSGMDNSSRCRNVAFHHISHNQVFYPGDPIDFGFTAECESPAMDCGSAVLVSARLTDLEKDFYGLDKFTYPYLNLIGAGHLGGTQVSCSELGGSWVRISIASMPAQIPADLSHVYEAAAIYPIYVPNSNPNTGWNIGSLGEHIDIEGVCEPTTWSPPKSETCEGTLVIQTSNCQTTRSVYGIKDCSVDGECGSSNRAVLPVKPNTGLCSVGSSSTVSGDGPWTWSCTGTSGGETAFCGADPVATTIDGECGSSDGRTLSTKPTTNLCDQGTESTVTGTGPWNWNCTGLNNGTTASCSANKSGGVPVTNGSCGNANGHTFSVSDIEYSPFYQCSTGSSNNTTFPASGATETWICESANGGSDSDTCSAYKTDLPPVISGTFNVSDVPTGQKPTANWSTSNVVKCSLTGTNGYNNQSACLDTDCAAVSLLVDKAVMEETTYDLVCQNADGSTITDQVTPVAYTVLSADPNDVTVTFIGGGGEEAEPLVELTIVSWNGFREPVSFTSDIATSLPESPGDETTNHITFSPNTLTFSQYYTLPITKSLAEIFASYRFSDSRVIKIEATDSNQVSINVLGDIDPPIYHPH
ncbi:MAG: hypothetical protein U9P50_02470 [Patescibacteria group bacterium]|nr:hypothetical protein [Patescibacteria group bacterium]